MIERQDRETGYGEIESWASGSQYIAESKRTIVSKIVSGCYVG